MFSAFRQAYATTLSPFMHQPLFSMVDSTVLEVLAIAIFLHHLGQIYNDGIRRQVYPKQHLRGASCERLTS